MKKLAVFLAALMLLSSLAACSSSKTPETEYDSSGRPQDSQNAVSTTGKTVTTIPVDKLISESEAKSIAFKKTGVSKAAVSALEIDLDYDNDQKRWEYEVDFYVDKVEYEVDIDAETGEVVLFNKDDDTVSKKSKSTTKTTVATTTKEPTESVSTTTSS